MSAKTLYENIESHTIRELDNEGHVSYLYIDRSILNEYTSPQAFSGLRECGRNRSAPRTRFYEY